MGWEATPGTSVQESGSSCVPWGSSCAPRAAQPTIQTISFHIGPPNGVPAQRSRPPPSPSAMADTSSCSARISLASRVRYWQRRSSCCSTVAMRRERLCRQFITDGSALACRREATANPIIAHALGEDIQQHSEPLSGCHHCPQSRVPSRACPSNVGMDRPPGRNTDGSMGVPGGEGGGTQAFLTSRERCPCSGPQARAMQEGRRCSGIHSGRDRGSPVAQWKAQIPSATCCATPDHRLSSEKGEQWPLSQQSVNMSSAQNTAKPLAVSAVTNVPLSASGQDRLCENLVTQPMLQQGHSVRNRSTRPTVQ